MSSPGSGSRRTRGKNISTFCRIKPSVDKDSEIEHRIVPSIESGAKARQVIQFTKPKTLHFSTHSSGRKSQEYTFNEVFKDDASQINIFEQVGKDVVDNVLNGFNGTVFAYGQTATGKTYTIMGEELEYEDDEFWGLVPRSLDYIFDKLSEDTKHKFKVEISFLEVYRENMFDLLDVETFVVDKSYRFKKSRVLCKMDDDKVRLEGLCLKEATQSSHAMDIFLEGYQNREVAETYANDRSSRSHAVFTVYIYREDETGNLESKLHFVDLAGSERVSKDQLADEGLIAEAKEINRSLLFLHKVIKSISSGHKPETFRNTMITKILRDSLIGNSMTSLIATISLEKINFDETLATCDFAQSVSKIKTKPRKNKTEDLGRLLATLQEENVELRKRIAEMESREQQEQPSDPDPDDLTKLVVAYYNNDNANATLKVRENDEVSQHCFRKLKEIGKSDERKPTPTPLTDEEKRDLDARLASFLGRAESSDNEFHFNDNPNEAQYCIWRLKQIIKEFDERPIKKKGCC